MYRGVALNILRFIIGVEPTGSRMRHLGGTTDGGYVSSFAKRIPLAQGPPVVKRESSR